VSLERPGFVDTIDNPFMPLIPGTTLIYRGKDSEGHALLDRFTVTDETQMIRGVRTTVIRDRVFTDGELTEDTRDFFAQDRAGNVWYFGEVTREIRGRQCRQHRGLVRGRKEGRAGGDHHESTSRDRRRLLPGGRARRRGRPRARARLRWQGQDFVCQLRRLPGHRGDDAARAGYIGAQALRAGYRLRLRPRIPRANSSV
jgi:hypothetical protein